MIGAKRVQIKDVRTGREKRERKNTAARRRRKSAKAKIGGERQQQQFDTFLLCNARVIITGVRDGRLIMTF